MTHLLRSRGLLVEQQEKDAALDLDRFDAILILENCRWFPGLLRDLRHARGRRPPVIAWHWEPLPLPSSSGVPSAPLHLREWAKILLRDRRTNDVHSNLATLARLRRAGLPDVLAVSSRAWQESLAERGIDAHWVPYGAEPAPVPAARHDAPRDLEALFLGALDVPRRRRIFARLREQSVDLTAVGSWHSRTYWGASRSRLLRRAHAFLNVARAPGQVSADRLLLGMTHDTLVVSEPLYRPDPFVAGEHYVEARVEELPDVLRHYRENPRERDRIVARARRLVEGELRMDAMLDQLLSRVPGVDLAERGS